MLLDYAEKFMMLNRDSSYVVFSGTHLCLRIVCEGMLGIWREKLEGGAKGEVWKGIEISRLRQILKESHTVLSNLRSLYVVADATLLVTLSPFFSSIDCLTANRFLYFPSFASQYNRGVRAKLEGDEKKAKETLNKGLIVSQRLNLRLEEGLFLLELAFLEPYPVAEKILQACDIIESTGAKYHLSFARKRLPLQDIIV